LGKAVKQKKNEKITLKLTDIQGLQGGIKGKFAANIINCSLFPKTEKIYLISHFNIIDRCL